MHFVVVPFNMDARDFVRHIALEARNASIPEVESENGFDDKKEEEK